MINRCTHNIPLHRSWIYDDDDGSRINKPNRNKKKHLTDIPPKRYVTCWVFHMHNISLLIGISDYFSFFLLCVGIIPFYSYLSSLIKHLNTITPPIKIYKKMKKKMDCKTQRTQRRRRDRWRKKKTQSICWTKI